MPGCSRWERFLAILSAVFLLNACSLTGAGHYPASAPPAAEAASGPEEESGSRQSTDMSSNPITAESTVREIENLPVFRNFGELLFPADRPVRESASLENLTEDGTFVWYSNLRADVFAAALNCLKDEAEAGNRIFYPIYTEQEIAADPSKADTGLFFFRGREGAPFAIVNAGGGFSYPEFWMNLY